jgi:hypothetical protein
MYFETAGPGNTGETIRIALEAARERNIPAIVFASNSGETAEKFAGGAEKAGYAGSLVCVTHACGFRENGVNEMSAGVRRRLEDRGLRVYTASHVLSGAERAMSRAFQGLYPVEIIAHSLRMFGQGVKVCVEISVMALDGGMLPYGKPLIAAGGTGTGLDTALILSPAHASGIFGTKIHEILCKPR